MSASHEWTDWHLTPTGWVEGTSKLDSGATHEKPVPADRVLTVRWDEFLGAVQGKMHRTHKEQWRSNDGALVAQLLAQFGPAPRSL